MSRYRLPTTPINKITSRSVTNSKNKKNTGKVKIKVLKKKRPSNKFNKNAYSIFLNPFVSVSK